MECKKSSTQEDVCLRLDEPFDENTLRLKAEKELNETKEIKERALKELRLMLKSDLYLFCPIAEDFLLRFLRARKFDAARAFKLLQNYYKTQIKFPDVFQSYLPSTVEHILNTQPNLILPYRDQYGRVIFIAQTGKTHPSLLPFHIGLRAILMCAEKIIEDEATQINGVVFIHDFRHMSSTQLRYLAHPRNAYCIVNLIQESFPVRLKAVHVINEPSIVDLAYSLVKPLLKQKIKQRVMFHGYDLSSLHKYIPQAILPEEYGGTLKTTNAEWMSKLIASEEEFREKKKYGYIDPVEKYGILGSGFAII